LAEKLKIIPLGGLNEIGKNMTVLEYGKDIIIVDCGLGFPDEEMYGVDLVIADMTYLVKNKDKIRGMFLTHGHEDHIGGIPYAMEQFNCPIHATRLTDCPSAERSINWIDGRFCFEHDTFGEIVAELKRYYNVDIRFMDNRLRDMRFSGNFRVEDGIYHIMSVLQLTYKFNYRIAGNDIELYANPER